MAQGVIFTPEQDAAIASAVHRVLSGRPRPARPRAGIANQQSAYCEGKAVADIAKGEWGEIDVWEGPPGDEVDAGFKIPVFNRFGDVAEGTYCGVWYLNGAWRVQSAECGS